MTVIALEGGPDPLATPHEAHGPKEGTVSATATTINLITCGLGAGILSLPWTAAGASVIGSLVITCLVLFLNGATILILVEAAEKYQVFDIGGIVSHLPGKLGQNLQIFINVLLWVMLFLCIIGYNIIAADSAMPAAQGAGPFWETRAVWTATFTVAGSVLCFVPETYLSFSSMLCVLVNIYLLVFVLYIFFMQEDRSAKPGTCYFGFGPGSISMTTGLMMCCTIQMLAVNMYGTLEQRSVPKFRRILFSGFGFLLVMLLIFQTVALFTYGPGVESNVLNMLPNNAAGSIARLGIVLCVLAVYPMCVNGMVEPILVSKRFGGKPALVTLVKFFIITFSMVVAFFVKDLGVMNVANGALSVSGYVALAPGFVGIYLVGIRRRLMIGLMALGLAISILGLVFTDNYVDTLREYCYWEA